MASSGELGLCCNMNIAGGVGFAMHDGSIRRCRPVQLDESLRRCRPLLRYERPQSSRPLLRYASQMNVAIPNTLCNSTRIEIHVMHNSMVITLCAAGFTNMSARISIHIASACLCISVLAFMYMHHLLAPTCPPINQNIRFSIPTTWNIT